MIQNGHKAAILVWSIPCLFITGIVKFHFKFLTCTDKVLFAELKLALVKARGDPVAEESLLMKEWSGTLIPTRSVAGLRCGFRISSRSKMTVTGPGRRSCRRSSGTETLLHLKKIEMLNIHENGMLHYNWQVHPLSQYWTQAKTSTSV